MKLRSLFFGTLCMLMLGVSFTSCSDDDDDKVLIKRTMPASHTMIPIKETM